MYTVYANERLTRIYADGWNYLDTELFVAEVKVTPPKQTEAPQDYDDGGKYVQYARAPSGVNMRRLIEGLRDTMGGSNCKHEYDCCGCATRHVSVRHLGSRRLLIHTRISFNY